MNWDYIAGFFDGEGNLHINRINNTNKNKNNYSLVIRFYSSNEEILKKIQGFLKMGQIYTSSGYPNWHDVFELTICSKKEVKFILRNILNRIYIKKEIVQYALERYSFKVGDSNQDFDMNKFRSFVTRKKANI